MRVNRRNFLKFFASAGLLGFGQLSCSAQQSVKAIYARLDEALAKPVLKKEYFTGQVKIAAIDLLRNGNNFIVHVKSTDGAEGFAMSNNSLMISLYPIVLQRVIPYFIGKDARDLDSLIDEVYVWKSNYKWQGLPFWACVASVEFAILDMLGNIAQKPLGLLLGELVRDKVAVYQANNHRGKSAEESVALIQKSIEETGAKAVKYKIGGRMRHNEDSYPGRTEALIPLVRKVLGDELTLYADSNGSFDVPYAIEIGRMLEDTNVSFYEEPCPFDQLEETKQVADALTIPIAGGEQESSLHRFRWMIANNCLQVVQPDLFYFGGFVRSIKVARMAQANGIPCTPHISGSGLGYLYMIHFASCVPYIGPYQEFKGFNRNIPIECLTSKLESINGNVDIPTGPGFGITYDQKFIREAINVLA